MWGGRGVADDERLARSAGRSEDQRGEVVDVDAGDMTASVAGDLVRAARAMKLNLSEVLEDALEQALREAEARKWLAENHDAIGGYNRRVAARGVFSDAWRRF